MQSGLHSAPEGDAFGAWEWDAVEDAVHWSPQLCRALGLRAGQGPRDLAGWLARVHPDDRARVEETLREAAESGRAFLFECRLGGGDGQTRRVRCDGLRVRWPGGAPRLVGICQDVTAAAVSARAMRRVELRFRDAFEHAPIGVALVSLDGDSSQMIEANEALTAMTGRSAEELIGSTLDSITLPEDRARGREELRRLTLGEIDSYTVEKRIVHRAGDRIWCQLSVSLAQPPAAAGDEDAEGPLAMVQIHDVSERRRFEQRLRYLADHDSLTGLLNRRRFRAELDQRFAFNARYGGRGAVLIADLDEFKRVNDTLGHHAGDNLLRRVAGLMRERVRSTDVVARLAGDEFAVLMPQVDRPGALQLGQDLCRAIAEGASPDPSACAATASIGIALFGGEDRLSSAEAVLVAADAAMYRAKLDGRDRVAVHDERAGAKPLARRGTTTAARIRQALTSDRFSLHSQPILDLASGTAIRHELLLRMGTDGEIVPAAAFIETAEKAGMVQELDRWVVARALELVAERERDGRNPSLHVNLSGASITDLSVLEFIERHLDEAEADPAHLTFEITETAAIHNFEVAAAFADRLTEFGCQVAIDDYGAGFGPFYYLRHLPFDLIKIDGDFVRNMASNDADQLTVQAIVGIARGLGKKTIAEFVQDDRTAEMLREYGVDMAQGYHLGEPRALEPALSS